MHFASHYVFRWRTAMNEYYTEHWAKLRHIEGASQRARRYHAFCICFRRFRRKLHKGNYGIDCILPILFELSKQVKVLPIVGEIDHSLVWAAIVWAILVQFYSW